MRRAAVGRAPGLGSAQVLAVAAFVLAAAGCAGNAAPEGEPPAAAAADSVTGEVRRVGSTPFTRTVVEGDTASITVTGPLESELARLSGARVRVVGELGRGDGPGPALLAERYEILSVDGDEPRVGMLRHEAGAGYRLQVEGGETVALRSVPPALGGVVGARVWVVLSDAGGVLRYGVLREP